MIHFMPRWSGFVTVCICVLATACGGGSSKAEAPTTTTIATTTTTVAATTTTTLSDAATTWCNTPDTTGDGVLVHAAALFQAATSLHVISVLATVQVKTFTNADGTRNLDALKIAWEKANGDPEHFPHYQEPTGPIAIVDLVTGTPWVWWDYAGWARICNAAFDSR